ncbi:uncharacterized protein [Argopecten irradians]|uniref:uncharacterized protein n=1 Tax=Argopecten irradians TaxID=31199 RepID=UPI0037108A44
MNLGWTAFTLLFCDVIHYISADAIHLLIVTNASCSEIIDGLNEHDSYQLNWDGGVLSPNCKLGFTAKSIISSEAKDKYKICVNTFLYQITECSFKMKYYSGDKRDTMQEYSCGPSQPDKFCTDEGDMLAIGLSNTLASNSSFQLIITAVKTYTSVEDSLPLVYAVIVGLPVLCVLLSCTIILMICKKHQQVQQSRIASRTHTSCNDSPVPTVFFPGGVCNQGYRHTEPGLYPHIVTISPPEYSEKDDKHKPPPYSSVNDGATKA